MLPAPMALTAAGAFLVALVKPQFEVGRARVGPGGVVRDPELRAEAALRVAGALAAHGTDVVGAADSGLPGPKGNRELFLHATAAPGPVGEVDEDAVAGAARV